MTSRLLPWWLGLHALTFWALGALFLLDPETWGTQVSLTPAHPAGVAELMTLYGGLECALAALLTWGVLKPHFRITALQILLVCYAGLTFGRTLGLLRHDLWDHGFTLQLFAIEAGTTLISAFFYFRGQS